MKRRLVLVGILAGLWHTILLILFLCLEINSIVTDFIKPAKQVYMWDVQYARAAGVEGFLCSYYDFCSFMNLNEEYKPQMEGDMISTTIDDITYRFYPGDFGDVTDIEEYKLYEIEITNPEVVLGPNRIRVGSSAEEVQEAYKKNHTVYEVEELGKGYIDGIIDNGNAVAVRFLYDAGGLVEKITITKEW